MCFWDVSQAGIGGVCFVFEVVVGCGGYDLCCECGMVCCVGFCAGCSMYSMCVEE